MNELNQNWEIDMINRVERLSELGMGNDLKQWFYKIIKTDPPRYRPLIEKRIGELENNER